MDVSPEGSGTTTLNENPSASYPCNYSLEGDTEVRIEAIPVPGYQFVRWEGDLTGSENPAYIPIDSDKSVIAHFSRVMYSLLLDVDGSGTVNPSSGAYIYEEGHTLEITAVPDKGWEFTGWEGSLPGTVGETVSLTMDEDYQLKAVFSRVYHSLTVNLEGNGLVTPVPGSHTYPEGETVGLVAIPDDGWVFSGWSGDAAPADGEPGILMDSDKTLTAVFTKQPVNWGLIGGIAGGILVIGAGLFWVLKVR